MNLEDIKHSKILKVPEQPQQVLTIGLVQKLISMTFPKFGLVLNEINYYLNSSARAFTSHAKSSLENAFSDIYGFVPDFGQEFYI